MQALKALVVFMAILIFIAMGFLVYGLLTKIEDDPQSATRPTVAPFNVIESRLPAGASVADVKISEGRIVATIRMPGGGAEIRVFDLQSGSELGTIRLGAQP